MTTYTSIPLTDIDQDSPATQPLFVSLRDNPTAIAEGSSGAPVIQAGWHPYNKVDVGDSFDGNLFDGATDPAVSSIESPVFDPGYGYMFYWQGLTSGTYTVSLYKDTDAAYQTGASFNTGTSKTAYGYFIIEFPALQQLGANFLYYSDSIPSGALIGPTHGSIFDATVQKITRMKLTTTASFTAGKLFLYRKREYITA